MVDELTVIIVPSALRPQVTIDGMSIALKSGKCPGACTPAQASLKTYSVTASDSCCCCTFSAMLLFSVGGSICNMQIQEVCQIEISILTGVVKIFKIIAFLLRRRKYISLKYS